MGWSDSWPASRENRISAPRLLCWWERRTQPAYTQAQVWQPAAGTWYLLTVTTQVHPFLLSWTSPLFIISSHCMFFGSQPAPWVCFISDSSQTCPAASAPCWACTSRLPLCWSGNALRLTCWKQEVFPLTLMIRPGDRVQMNCLLWVLFTLTHTHTRLTCASWV